jgi:hypothetical protein
MTRTVHKRPTVGMSAANEPNPARLAAELQAIALALRIGGLEGLRSGAIKIGRGVNAKGPPPR